MAKREREVGGKGVKRAPARRIQLREVYLLDELGRFVAGSTSEGVPILEGMVKVPTLALAQAMAVSREVPPGTFLSMTDGDTSVTAYGGGEFFGCAGNDAAEDREVPHELAAVVKAFERAVRREIEAGGLTHASIEGFPRLAAGALREPEKYAPAPQGPLTFARARFRTSGARLALDIEVVNATPWEATKVELQLTHDQRALPLVSVKAKGGGFAHGVLTLPAVPARTRDRAVLLFEPRQAGVHQVEGVLALGLDGGGLRQAPMRRARTAVSKARVVATVPKSLADFQGLVGGKLQFSSLLELPTSRGGLTTVAGLATEIEKDNIAKVLDWRGARGEREVWYLGLSGGPERPILVQVAQGEAGPAEVTVAAAKRVDVLGYCAQLRSRMDLAYAGAPVAPAEVKADEEPEERPAVVRAVVIAKQISADLEGADGETAMRRPAQSRAAGRSTSAEPGGGQSAGDEMVPGLIDALERSFAIERMMKRR